ncbi:NAD(P)-dependent oxidoreductase [Bacillus sp. H-16]|uniref:NAD(P)-dependent oxidoreductase n=1 Tax=Alteribacter salitolerans TaxID=2912333 RepID=UPI00196565B4|nr:NAD(P)-dependent oxidoreductase [Alteribacter salitolerans]MBM7095515.1 NAD(P)-dependent oxidoreductase [Alteribacter salitolerans]
MQTEKTTIGFIGTGVMGKSMAGHLIDAGYNVHVYTRTKEKADPLLNRGATWCDNPADIARLSDVIITIVGYPKDVEEIYSGESGLLMNAKEGTILIDMTTSSPLLAERLHNEGKDHGVHVLDAPVSGGDIGAKEGRLAIMVGGEESAFEQARPVLLHLGTNIVYQGQAGSGQHTKMSNQIAIAGTMLGASEALAYAKNAGLEPEQVLKSIETGAAGSWTLSNLVPRMIQEDYSPGFFIKHFIKDMKIALDVAEELNLRTPGLRLAKELYEELAENGEADSGTQALIKYYLSK